nr:RlmE family RNA methyltransferase [uncultured Treponema sp.]
MGNQYQEPDYWSRKAFSEGYPARSVYKLEEMQKKFNLFGKNGSVLDLGAAPGSWTVFLLRFLSPEGRVCAVDLQPLSEAIRDDRLSFFQGDLTSPAMAAAVKAHGPYRSVICDAAPATTGNKTVDTARSAALVETALYYAETQLEAHGSVVVKIFQGGAEQQYLKHIRSLFKTARAFKPEACRSSSFETYLIGLDFKENAQR